MNPDPLMDTVLRQLGRCTIVVTPLDDGDAAIFDRHTSTLYADPRTPDLTGAIRECLIDQLPQARQRSDMQLVAGNARAYEPDRTRPDLRPVWPTR